MPAIGFGDNMNLLMAIRAIKEPLIAAAVMALIAGFSTRHDLVRAADRTLCKREFKERTHNRSFIEWVFLTNLKDVIPKSMYVWYYTELALWPIFSIAFCVMAINGSEKKEILHYLNLYYLVAYGPVLIYWWIFMGRDKKNGHFEPRFIPRRHVMTQKHTQQKKGKKHTQRKNRK